MGFALEGGSFHLPIITLALSGFRETGLLVKGHTDLATAGKHMALDVTGVGGGGMVGSKAGALIGGAIGGPIGAALGGFAGAVLGAIFGRGITNHIKMANYRKALEYLNQNLYNIARKLPAVIDNKINLLQNKADRIPRRLGVSFFDWLWPSRKWLIAREITDRIRKAISELQDKKNQLLSKMQQPKENEISPGGIMAYNLVIQGGYYYPSVKADIYKVKEALDFLENERRKLGK